MLNSITGAPIGPAPTCDKTVHHNVFRKRIFLLSKLASQKMYFSIFSLFLNFFILSDNESSGKENCYRTADWSPYRSTQELKEKNKTLFHLLHDDEVLFLLLPATECAETNCRIDYSSLGSTIIPRPNRRLFFDLILKFGKKYKFKKCSLEQFFHLEFRYHFDHFGNLFPDMQWLEAMSDYYTSREIKDNFVLMPLQWFYDSRSILLYKQRLVAYYFQSNGATNWKGEPVLADLQPTCSASEFFYHPKFNSDKIEL